MNSDATIQIIWDDDRAIFIVVGVATNGKRVLNVCFSEHLQDIVRSTVAELSLKGK